MKQKSTKPGAFAKGGSGKMAGKSQVAPAEGGKVSVGGRKGSTSFGVSGGGKKMAGKGSASPAKPM